MLSSNTKVVTKIYDIRINEIKIAYFDMINKYHAIKHIIDSNLDIRGLQGMYIKWIGWKSTPKTRQKLASLVIKFFTVEYEITALDYNILIG